LIKRTKGPLHNNYQYNAVTACGGGKNNKSWKIIPLGWKQAIGPTDLHVTLLIPKIEQIIYQIEIIKL
jgi:hypothetical protein